jgi:hypothetical protein
MKKALLFLLIAAMLLSLCACRTPEPPACQDEPKDAQPPEQAADEENEPEQNVPSSSEVPKEKIKDFFKTDKTFCADYYTQDLFLSWVYSLDIRVENGQLFLNDHLFEDIIYTEDFEVVYLDGFMESQKGRYPEKVETLEKLQCQKEFYIIRSEECKKYGYTIALCYLEGMYYFLACAESGEVFRIHAGNGFMP